MFAFVSSIGSSLVTIVSSIFIFGIVIFIHELGHFLTAKLSHVTVNEFALGMGPTIFKTEKNGTTYALRLFPIGGFVSMEGENEESDVAGAFTKAPVGNRILITIAGAAMNLLLGFVVLLVIVSTSENIVSRQIASFAPDASTQATGLQVDDKIVAVNGRRCYIANDIMYEFVRTKSGVTDLTVLRNGEIVELDNVEFATTVGEDGTPNMVIDFKVYGIEKTFSNIVREATNTLMSYARLVVVSGVDLIMGRVPMNELAGPVGMIAVISEASSLGFSYVLQWLALITVNLGIFNLMPIPALDGGRLVFLIVEAVFRRPVPQKFEIAVHAIGFLLLMALMLFVAFNDVLKLIM